MLKYPHPTEVAESAARIFRLSQLTFEVEIAGWRLVTLHGKIPFPNRIRPELSILFFTVKPVIATPYLSDIGGLFATSNMGVTRGIASWMPSIDTEHLARMQSPLAALQHSRPINFRPKTVEAEEWLRLQLAKAAGMRYREHSILTPHSGRVIYTRTP